MTKEVVMSHFVVWLDSEHAHLFKLQPGSKAEKHLIERHEPDHHTHNTRDVPKNSQHLFRDVAERLKDASAVLLVGPVLAHDHFKAYLAEHHHAELAGRIVGSERMDHPSDNQIEALAEKFFNKP